MVITVGVIVVAASVIITICGEGNFFFELVQGSNQPSMSQPQKRLKHSSVTVFPVLKAKMHPCLISFKPRPPFMVWLFRVKTHYHCQV